MMFFLFLIIKLNVKICNHSYDVFHRSIIHFDTTCTIVTMHIAQTRQRCRSIIRQFRELKKKERWIIFLLLSIFLSLWSFLLISVMKTCKLLIRSIKRTWRKKKNQKTKLIFKSQNVYSEWNKKNEINKPMILTT